MKTKVTLDLLYNCHVRFHGKNGFDDDRINKLVGRLSKLDDDEKNVILELTDKFYYEDSIQNILTYLESAYRKIPHEKFEESDNVFVVPLKAPKEKERKSSDYIFEFMQLLTDKIKCGRAKIIFCSSPNELIKEYISGNVIVFVDDFIGSGDTSFDVIADIQLELYKNKKEADVNCFCIVTLFAMEQGINYLQIVSLNGYCHKSFKRAISDDDKYTPEEKRSRLELITSAEKKILIRKLRKIPYGYSDSESIISILNKSPNNTFPFYWGYAKNKELQSIFPRKQYEI